MLLGGSCRVSPQHRGGATRPSTGTKLWASSPSITHRPCIPALPASSRGSTRGRRGACGRDPGAVSRGGGCRRRHRFACSFAASAKAKRTQALALAGPGGWGGGVALGASLRKETSKIEGNLRGCSPSGRWGWAVGQAWPALPGLPLRSLRPRCSVSSSKLCQQLRKKTLKRRQPKALPLMARPRGEAT